MQACNSALHAVVGSVLGRLAPHKAPHALVVDAPQVVARLTTREDSVPGCSPSHSWRRKEHARSTQPPCRFGTFLTPCAVVALIAILALMGLDVPNTSAIGTGDEDEDQCGFSIASFYPSSSTIDAGQSTTLFWQVQVPRGCTVHASLSGSPEAAGSVGLTGSKTVHPVSTTTYRLTATSLTPLRQVSVTTTVTVKGPNGPLTDWELAFYHAPIHYQDTNSADAVADFLTRFDYDGNVVTSDNWDYLHTAIADLRGAVYYSVVETCTHWFIIYAMFHPRDWVDGCCDQEHENDFEGLLAIVRKDGSRYGRLEGIVTVAHWDFYSYTPAGSPLTAGQESIDGVLQMQADPVDPSIMRPRTFQEAEGHGLTALPPSWQDFAGRDGVIYFPGGIGDVPTSGNDRNVQYELIDVFAPRGLWELQLQEVNHPGLTFATWGKLQGDTTGGCGDGVTVTCAADAANAPWGWDDGNDPHVYRGEIALDPAHLVDLYFNYATYVGPFSYTYLRNPYLKRLQDLRSQHGPGWRPAGWPDELDLGTLVNKLSTSCYVTEPLPLPDDDGDPFPPPPPACSDISMPQNCHEQ